MKNMFKHPHNIMLYKERTEFQEQGHAKKEYGECRICRAVYYRKSWHHRSAVNIEKIKKQQSLWATRCPACKMIADHQYEGMITIENIPGHYETELLRLVKAYTHRAYQKDCQHRLIAVHQDAPHTWRVTTTENQLAVKLARKVRSVFNKVTLNVSFSKEPDDVERVTVRFQPLLSSVS
jgi:hypothetical protein